MLIDDCRCSEVSAWFKQGIHRLWKQGWANMFTCCSVNQQHTAAASFIGQSGKQRVCHDMRGTIRKHLENYSFCDHDTSV